MVEAGIMPDDHQFIAIPFPNGDWRLRHQPHGTVLPPPDRDMLEKVSPPFILAVNLKPGHMLPTVSLQSTHGDESIEASFNPSISLAWLHQLRSWGVLTLDPVRCKGSTQKIPRHFSLPPEIISRRCLGQYVEERALDYRGIWTTRDLFAIASPTSILGIAQDLGLQDELLPHVHRYFRRFWLDLVTPLYTPPTSQEDGNMAFRIACASDQGESHFSQLAFKSHLNIRVNRTGAARIHEAPIDAFGLEPSTWAWAPFTSDEFPFPPDKRQWSLASLVLAASEQMSKVLDDLLRAPSDSSGTAFGLPSRSLAIASHARDLKPLFVAHLQDNLRRIELWSHLGIAPHDGADRPFFLSMWLSEDRDDTTRAFRFQALEAMPNSIPEIVYEGQQEALNAIDNGKPLTEAVQAAYGVQGWVARRSLRSNAACFYKERRCTSQQELKPFCAAVRLVESLGQDCPEPDQDTLAMLPDWLVYHPSNESELRSGNSHRLLGAIGLAARRFGWKRTTTLLARLESACLSLLLLESVMEATVDKFLDPTEHPMCEDQTVEQRSKIVDAWFSVMDASELLARAERLAILHWDVDAPALQVALRAASAEWNLPFRHRPSITGEPCQLNLLQYMSWVSTAVSVTPLLTRNELVDEGRRMQNCIASYWPRAHGLSSLFLALEDRIGSRVNAELVVCEDRSWEVREIAGKKNESVLESSALYRTAQEICCWLSLRPECLNMQTLDAYRAEEPMDEPGGYYDPHVDLSQFNRLSIQALSEPLKSEALACLPGAGALNVRIRHAIKRAHKASTSPPGAHRDSHSNTKHKNSGLPSH